MNDVPEASAYELVFSISKLAMLSHIHQSSGEGPANLRLWYVGGLWNVHKRGEPSMIFLERGSCHRVSNVLHACEMHLGRIHEVWQLGSPRSPDTERMLAP